MKWPGARPRSIFSAKMAAKAKRRRFTSHTHLPLRLWLQAIHLLCSSKKGISTRQLQRMLGCGMKTAWHLGHRIRHGMAPHGSVGPLGGAGKVIEADETELARSRKTKRPAGFRRSTHNPIVMSLVERGGDIRSTFLDHQSAVGIIRKNVHHESRLVTDTAARYKHVPVASHDAVDHSKFRVGSRRRAHEHA
jgi:hypothetical protein